MKTVALLILVGLAGVARAADTLVDEDIRALAEVKLFAFDTVALSGRSQGEVALSRLLKREDKIRPLIAVYNRGTTEAKVYVLAAFHHLAPSLFEQCKRDLVGKYNPLVRAMSGCLPADGTLLEFLIRIYHGEYDGYIRTHSSGQQGARANAGICHAACSFTMIESERRIADPNLAGSAPAPSVAHL